MFGNTAGSMFSDIKKKVTSWDKNAHLDPTLTQRVLGGMNNSPALGQTFQNTVSHFDSQGGASTRIFGVGAGNSTIYEDGREHDQVASRDQIQPGSTLSVAQIDAMSEQQN